MMSSAPIDGACCNWPGNRPGIGSLSGGLARALGRRLRLVLRPAGGHEVRAEVRQSGPAERGRLGCGRRVLPAPGPRLAERLATGPGGQTGRPVGWERGVENVEI